MMAAAALYQAEFGLAEGVIPATVSMISFIGWKYSSSQQKELRPGPVVGGVEFT